MFNTHNFSQFYKQPRLTATSSCGRDTLHQEILKVIKNTKHLIDSSGDKENKSLDFKLDANSSFPKV